MQTKHSSPRLALLACLVSAFGLQAAQAVSAPDISAPDISAPRYSLTGSLLGSIVAVQRNTVPDADVALYDAVRHGFREPGFVLMALRFAAMDEGLQAAKRAHALALMIPEESLARLIMGTAAFHERRWTDAENLLTLHAKASQSFLHMVGAGFRDWCLFGANPLGESNHLVRPSPVVTSGSPRKSSVLGKQGHGVTAMQRVPGPVAYLTLLQQARIASLRNESITDSLFARLDKDAASVPPLLYVQKIQFEADWLAFHHRDDEARTRLREVGRVLPAFQLVLDRLRPGEIGTSFSPNQGLAEFYVGVTALLGDTASSDYGDDQDENKLKDVRHLKILLLRQALFLQPNLTLAKILLAEELRNDDQLSMAQSALNQVAEDDPLAPLSDHAQAQIALKRQDLTVALRAFERVAKANPHNADILNELGITQDRLGQSRAAVETFTRALDQVSVMQAHVWSLLLGRAIAWDHLKQREKAQADLDHALALAPSEPVLLNYAGYSDVEHDERPVQALTLLRHALDLAPDDAEIRDSYAWGLLKQNGDLTQALPLLLSAANMSPGDAEIAYHLGVAYWYQGRQLEARDQWGQALNNKPEPDTRALIEAALSHGPDLSIMRGRPLPLPR